MDISKENCHDWRHIFLEMGRSQHFETAFFEILLVSPGVRLTYHPFSTILLITAKETNAHSPSLPFKERLPTSHLGPSSPHPAPFIPFVAVEHICELYSPL